MQLYDSHSVWGDFFRITYVENTGMAFGINVSNNFLLTLFATIASIIILVYFFLIKGEHIVARTSMAIIFGGALGNIFDRITRGSVVDFLDFEFFDIAIPKFDFLFIHFPGYSMTRWPVFNVADISVTVGMILLLIFIAFDKEPQTLPAESNMEPTIEKAGE